MRPFPQKQERTVQIKIHLESGKGDADKDMQVGQRRFPVILGSLGLRVPYLHGPL